MTTMTPSTAEQVRLQLCGQCAKRVPGTARFCPRCGTRLRPGSPGDNTYLAVHKAMKSRSEQVSKPLVIPRPVMPAAEPRKTAVLGYEPPTARRQQPPPRTPTAKKPSKWPLVLVAIFGFRMLVYALSQDHSGSSAKYPPPPRSYTPQPPSYIDTPPYKRNPPLTTATPSRPKLAPNFAPELQPFTITPPSPSALRPIPGTSLSLDQQGHVHVNSPTPPTPPVPPGGATATPARAPHR